LFPASAVFSGNLTNLTDNKPVVVAQWTKEDSRREKNQESIKPCRNPLNNCPPLLSFLIKLAILQEGTGLTQDEEL